VVSYFVINILMYTRVQPRSNDNVIILSGDRSICICIVK